MNKKKNLIFFLILILLVNCSFDTKTGIWTGDETVKKKVADLEKEQIRQQNTKKIYLFESSLELSFTSSVILSTCSVIPSLAFLNSFKPNPKPLANSGSFFPPNKIIITININAISQGPKLIITPI